MWPCYLGVDMASRDELIAANKTLDEIRDAVGADTLGYLSLEGLFRATGRSGEHFCAGCLTGQYPVRVDASAGKHALEAVAHAD
jgi:amidophosphoribosyltransferase